MMRLALKISISSGLPAFILAAAVLYYHTGSASGIWITAAGFGLIIALISYLTAWLLLARRIGYIRRLMKAISEKEFENLPEINPTDNDELDRLIEESAVAASTIETEFSRLTKLENYRKDFIGDISHELKTPIFAIQGFVETLLDGALEDKEVNRHFLKKTMKNVNRLTILTNDLMEIAKLETGELTSHIQPLFIADCINEVQEILQYRAAEEKVTLETKVEDDRLKVMADRNQLRQVLVNLAENGIKYNRPGGRVVLRVRRGEKNGRVHVSVEDTGIGIEPEHIARVTERFFRVDKSRSRDKGGTGLGLAIVKHILESHGTGLQVESRPGEGSVFRFYLKSAPGVSA